MASKSRSRSRSASPKRHRRNNREDSISPIRTASGANLRTPKNYNSGNYRNNFQYNNNNYGYQQRNYGYNNNNRGYYNQRYNNYGRWNRGRGNFRGQWNYRNQWNNDRRPYNPRNERSRSRSRSKSYDSRDRSRSRSLSDSHSRSRSRSLSREKSKRTKNRSESATSNERGRSNSKSPPKLTVPKQELPEPIKKEEVPKARVVAPSNQPDVEMIKMASEDQQHFTESDKFTRSRWETPDASPDGRGKRSGDMDLEKDEIFDQWDDDKLREYLLRSKGKKMGKEMKKMMESADPERAVKQKKKKRSKSNVESPIKDSKKKKKRAKQRSSSTSSSTSSDDWSPIHKAPQQGASSESRHMVEGYAPVSSQQQDFSQATAHIYSQQQNYSRSDERTQAVQYPFSHIRKPAPVPTPPESAPPAPTVQYPTPVPPPQAPTPPVLGEMQVLGLDGRAMRLVPTSVLGPDGKMIQVMQIQPAVSVATPQPPSVPPPVPVTQPKQPSRMPPPPPSYPPPTTQAASPGAGKYHQPTPHGNLSVSSQQPEGIAQAQSMHKTEDDQSSGYENISTKQNVQSEMMVQTVKNPSYEPSNHTSSLKKMEMMEKQKRRQEVLKTRFTPRPARSWPQDVKKEEAKETSKPAKPHEKREGHAIPSLGDPSNKAMLSSQSTEFSSGFSNEQIFPAAAGMDVKTVAVSGQPPTGLRDKEIGMGQPMTRDVQPPRVDDVSHGSVSFPTTLPPELAARGFKPMQGNPQVFIGPNGEMLQMVSSPQQPAPRPPSRPPQVEADAAPSLRRKTPETKKQATNWSTTADDFIHNKQHKVNTKKEDSSDEEEEEDVAIPTRMRAISAGSEKKSKKKARAASTDDTGEDEEPVKRKKEKKKKKKNKKKKEEVEDDAPPVKEKKKKKVQKAEKTDVPSLEHETIKSKKDWKAFEEVKKKSKKDHLKRTVDDDLPLSHIRSIVPRKKGEATHLLFRHVVAHESKASSLATSTSYEDRFVSLFGSGEAETALPLPDQDGGERVDITKKSVRKFKVNVKGVRNVTHMTEISLSERMGKWGESESGGQSSQRVSLNVSNLSKVSRSTRSASRSCSRSSSAVSDSPKATKKKRRKSRPSRSSSRSRSKSRSMSLPAAYAGADDKSGRHGGRKSRSRSNDYSDDDLRHDLDKRKADRDKSGSRSRSRSRSYSSDEDRNRNRGRQMYYNNNYNNRGFYYNNRGRGNRGYYQNYRGRPWYNNNNRGNWRGRWNYNWNNQGWNNNNRNPNYRNYQNYQNYQRYDNRDHRFRGRSRSRSRSRDDRSSSRERDDKRSDKASSRDNSAQEQPPPKTPEVKDQAPPAPANAGGGSGGAKPPRKPSPAQWGHDMFEEHEMDGGKQDGAAN